MLLQNKDTGAYFYADARSIEYKTRQPHEDGYDLKIEFPNGNATYAGSLSYL
ncbi:unnamed protein product, partial [Rotaria sordida]